ncbi:MAG: ABC transporter permease [Methylocystis sp.]|uniref:ABC transporter permease n=1 Tax=Methylocystis sp. TaxID=1911079 RepID=UPI003DA4967A
MPHDDPHADFGRAQDFGAKLRMSARLVGVVLLQDMRTRYGGRNHFGYLFGIALPVLHMSVITGFYYLRTLIAPVGESAALFAATGIAPYLLCLYPARQMCGAIAENRQLLSIPMLQPLHLMISRAILELLSAIAALLVFLCFLQSLEKDIWPNDPVEAAKAIGAAIFMGVGLGFFNLVMSAILGRFYQMAFTFLVIGLYLSAGVYFPIWSMPEDVREYAVYNPILQLVEWLRSAYYTSYEVETINPRWSSASRRRL